MILSVNPRLVRELTEANPVEALRLHANVEAQPQACYSAFVEGGLSVVYDPQQRLPHGSSAYMLTHAGVTVRPLPVGEAQEAYQRLIRGSGTPFFFHTNSHTIRSDKAHGTHSPCIAVRKGRSGKAQYAYAVHIHDGPAWVLVCPALRCGAKLVVIVESTVRFTPVLAANDQSVIDLMDDMIEELTGEGEGQEPAQLRLF